MPSGRSSVAPPHRAGRPQAPGRSFGPDRCGPRRSALGRSTRIVRGNCEPCPANASTNEHVSIFVGRALARPRPAQSCRQENVLAFRAISKRWPVSARRRLVRTINCSRALVSVGSPSAFAFSRLVCGLSVARTFCPPSAESRQSSRFGPLSRHKPGKLSRLSPGLPTS